MKPDYEKHKKDADLDFQSFLAALSGAQVPPTTPAVIQRREEKEPNVRPKEAPRPPKPAEIGKIGPIEDASTRIEKPIKPAEKAKAHSEDKAADTAKLEKEAPKSKREDKIALSHISVRASFTLEQLLETMIREKASDLHISVGCVPALRINSEIIHLELPDLDTEMAEELLLPVLNEEQRIIFEEEGDLDFSFDYLNKARFRCNYFRHHLGIGGTFRFIPYEIPRLEQLGLPKVVLNLLRFKKGLLLVVGPTGHGKTTTLAAMINEINRTRKKRIVTIENPIEYVFKSEASLISQREIGSNVLNYYDALWSVLREDPDIIMVSELWDPEDVRQVLKISETGHLVLTTMPTLDCVTAVERLVGIFPQEEHDQVRVMVSESLIGVIAQRLVPRADRTGRVLATEILITTTGLASIIREGKFQHIRSVIQTSRDLGMQTMDHSLSELAERRIITPQVAKAFSTDGQFLQKLGAR